MRTHYFIAHSIASRRIASPPSMGARPRHLPANAPAAPESLSGGELRRLVAEMLG